MMSQVFQMVLLGLVVCARAAPQFPAARELEPFDHNPQYSYSYTVQDAVTGDSKGHSETRNGDVVQGQYSVLDADGTRRIVEYTADAVHGFNAVVRREGTPAVSRALLPNPSPAPNSVLSAAPFVQYSTPRFSYTVPVAAPALPIQGFPAPNRLAVAGPSGVHTSVSTPFHSYSY